MNPLSKKSMKSSAAFRQGLHLFVTFILLFTSMGFAPSVIRGEPAQGGLFFDFEPFALGPLNGQNGWSNAGPEVTVTDQVYAVSGSKSVKIWDNDKTKAMGAKLQFQPIEKGTVEWWARADAADASPMRWR